MKTPGERKRDGLFTLALMTVTFVAYIPCLNGQFVWDDDSWTTSMEPYFRDVSGLIAMWVHPTVLQQYIPLTGTTFWLDYRFWRFLTLPYHVENVLLHGLAAVLFWRMLRRLKMPGAWLAGFIFALHPVMVESAAWITERKNMLSVVLFLSALFAYGKFTRFWADGDSDATAAANRDWKAWALATVLFFAALLAKATTFSFPPLLLLLAWWKRGRIRWRADVLPVIPLFVLAIGFGLFNSWIEKHHLGAQGSTWAFTLPERCLIAGRALWFYTGKLLWPANLCFVYPRWHIDASSLAQWLFPISAFVTLLTLWLARNRLGRGPAVAVYFFAGSLAPLLGFMNIYFMRYSFVCDHWGYLPSLGLVALGAAMVVRASEKFKLPRAAPVFALVVLPLFAVLTWHQSAMYANVRELYETTLQRNPNATMAHINLAQFLIATGDTKDAIDHLQTAVEQEPDEPVAHRKLGVALAHEGRAEEAIKEFQKAIALKPDFAGAYFSLGDTYYQQGRLAEAADQFKKTVEVDPTFLLAYNNLSAISLQQGHTNEAVAFQLDEAVVQLKNAVASEPGSAEAHQNLGVALFRQRHAAEAIAQFQRALELDPDNAGACNNLAWILATCPDPAFRNGPKALDLAQKADRLSGGNNPNVLATLAAAYAECGSPDKASAAARHAIEVATQTSPASVPALRQQLAHFLNDTAGQTDQTNAVPR